MEESSACDLWRRLSDDLEAALASSEVGAEVGDRKESFDSLTGTFENRIGIFELALNEVEDGSLQRRSRQNTTRGENS